MKKISAHTASALIANRNAGVKNTDLFATIKASLGIPATDKLAIEVDDVNSPAYLVVKNKHTGMAYADDNSPVPMPTAAPQDPAPAASYVHVAELTAQELQALLDNRASGGSNKPIFASIKARLGLDSDIKLKVEIDDVDSDDYMVIKNKSTGRPILAVSQVTGAQVTGAQEPDPAGDDVEQAPDHAVEQAPDHAVEQADDKADDKADAPITQPSPMAAAMVAALLNAVTGVNTDDDGATVLEGVTITIDRIVIRHS